MVGSSGAAAGAANDRFASAGVRDGRLSYVLRAPERRHRFGVSALALARDGASLFTAGRDGTVREWAPIPTTAHAAETLSVGSRRDLAAVPRADAAKTTFDEHVDWVNGLVLLHGGERLVTCSSDTTVKVWNTAQPSGTLRTLTAHTDYVKALAHTPNGVASASLDGRVLVWDLVTGRVRQQCGAHAAGDAPLSSVYCLAGSPEERCAVLVAGSTDKTVSVFDHRTGERVVRLRGHSDSVRCVALRYDGTQMLSGSSDSTVKLWDLRQERCIRSFDSWSSTSVWAIAADRDFGMFVSGGRDGTVWNTDLSSETVSLVVSEVDTDKRSNMVLDLALTEDTSAVWVSTTGSSVGMWSLEPDVNQVEPNGRGKHSGGAISNVVNNNARTVVAPPRLPMYRICGLPGILQYKILNDRRHVLTCNSYKEYCIWDITRGSLLKSLGVIETASIEEVAKAHDEEVSVPAWFNVDIRLGSLSVHLMRKYAFSAEVYAVDAGLDAETEDLKVNIGDHVVRALFAKWSEQYKEQGENRAEDGFVNGTKDGTIDGHNASSDAAERPNANRTQNLPPYIFADHIPVIVTEGTSPVPVLKQRVGAFTGTEEKRLPTWVVELVRDNRAPPRNMEKMAFTLHPFEGSDLPSLSTTTLTAPRVLRVRKVAAYISKEIRELELDESDIDILCNGQLIPPKMSLATVHHFRWKSPDDLRLQFRRRPKPDQLNT